MPRITMAMATVKERAKALGYRIKSERQSNGTTVYFLIDKAGNTIANPDDGMMQHLSTKELHDTLSRLSAHRSE